jgi:hypothetical protein
MQFLSIREFSKAPSAALSKLAQDEKAVLTNNGKPAAIVIPVNTESFERVYNQIQEVEKRAPAHLPYHILDEKERKEAFEWLMNFPRKKLPPDFDDKKELAAWRDERFGVID